MRQHPGTVLVQLTRELRNGQRTARPNEQGLARCEFTEKRPQPLPMSARRTLERVLESAQLLLVSNAHDNSVSPTRRTQPGRLEQVGPSWLGLPATDVLPRDRYRWKSRVPMRQPVAAPLLPAAIACSPGGFVSYANRDHGR